MLPSEHMANILRAEGYLYGDGTEGVVPESNFGVWFGKLPTNPNRVICFYDSGGLNPNPRWLLDYPSVQVRVRGGPNDYKVTGDKIKEVQSLLVGIPSFTATNGDRINHVNGLGGCAFTGYDDNNRPSWVCNFRLIIEPVPSLLDNRAPL